MTESFIAVAGSRMLRVGSIVSVRREGKYVVFDLGAETYREEYATVTAAVAAYAAYAATLYDDETLAVTGLVPSEFNQAVETGWAGWPAVLYGSGFSSGLNPIVQFTDGVSATWDTNTPVVLSAHAIALTVLPDADPTIVPAGAYEVRYYDDNHAVGSHLTVPGGATLFEEGTNTMQMYYGTDDAPSADPDLTDRAACYRGRTHNTVWMWDTEELKWWPVVNVS